MELLNSKKWALKMIFLSLLMTAGALVSLFIIPDDQPIKLFGILVPTIFVRIVSVLGVLLFGSALIFSARKFFDASVQLIVNSEGIEDKRLKIGLIEWNEIERVSLEQSVNSKWLMLNLNAPQNYYDKLPKSQILLRKINAQKGINDFKIDLSGLDKPAEEVYEFVERMMNDKPNRRTS